MKHYERLSAVFALALASVLTGCGGSGAGTPGSSPAFAPQQSTAFERAQSEAAIPANAIRFHAPLAPPRGTIYLGAYVAPTPDESPPAQILATEAFEKSINRKLAINLHYHLWSDTLAGVGEMDDVSHGRIPLVSWSCVDAGKSGVKDADIAAGVYDTAIANRAAALAQLGHPVFLRYKWEMNLVYNENCADPAHDITDKYGNTHYSPTEYIAAWQHMKSVFKANGATNVVWVWNPSGNGLKPEQYYPGDADTDWVAFDWYDSFNLYFDAIYDYSHNKNTGRNVWTYPYFSTTFPSKPIMIGETGAYQDWQKPYFRGNCCNYSAAQALREALNHIQAYVYWDSQGTRGNFQILSAGLPYFTRFANEHYLSGMGS